MPLRRTILLLLSLTVFGDRMPHFIDEWGYPAQSIQTTTQDGYVLTLHRIPFGKNENRTAKSENRRVVFLQHGLESTSSIFVSNYPNKSLGFLLADSGFDVWLGNCRGNIYSRQHKFYKSENRKYWKFSWYEMMKYDLTSMINKALEVTQQKQLYYIGHSQGTLIMFTKLASDNLFARKIRKYFALGPIASVRNIRGLIQILANKLPFSPMEIKRLLGYNEFIADNILLKFVKKMLCRFPFSAICENFLFMLGGPSEKIDRTRMATFMSDLPGGTSTMNIYHYMQMVRSGKVQAYDWHNRADNLAYYGTVSPPIFNLTQIDVDMYIYWGGRDWLSDKRDVETSLLSQLKRERVIAKVYLKNFNHFDFLWGRKVVSKVYKSIIKAIAADAFIPNNSNYKQNYAKNHP